MLDSIIRSLREDREFAQCVTRWEVIPAREGRYAEIPAEVDPRIREALAGRGITRLYSHQLAAFRAARAGRNAVIVTPTASGKTLSYNLPVLQTLLEDPDAKALYLFPTKALSQDQQSELNETVLGGGIPVRIYTYDGDTPGSIRIAARDEGRIIITNPDMLHTGVLPNHTKWIKVLSHLRYVVIDEVHSCRGVFGSHMTNLIRRLKRVAAFYGSKPVFLCCSATIGNPHDLARRIIEEDAELIDDNGAPSGERHFVLYNPPLVDAVQGIRRGVVLESQKIAARLLSAGVKTIVFCRSRIRTELIATYIRQTLANFYTDNHRIRVESYRGGYLPNERREIEKGLRSGAIQGVVSTNALELGIDIGGLDASVLAGFPGSIASSWQQAGRAGRRRGLSLSILVASSAPTDQFLVTHPEYFLGRSPESGYIDPDNPFILTDQLKCAAFELPFADGEGFGADTGDLLSYLEEQGVVRHAEKSWYWADRSYPSEEVSLRTSTPHNIVIVDTTKGRDEVIGEMDLSSAKQLLFDGAVYLHREDRYIVQKLDLENQRCCVEETDADYYTDSVLKTDLKVLHQDEETERFGARLILGDVLVRSEVSKFKKLKFRTHENVGFGDIHLPEDEMHTRALAIGFPPETAGGGILARMGESEKGIVLHRMGNAVKSVAPVFLLCDPRDIGVAERLRDPHFGWPCLFVYDQVPGGIGLAEGFLEKIAEILAGSLEAVERCPCESGCPSCIGPLDAQAGTEGGKVNPKKSFLAFFRAWLRAAEDGRG